LRRDPTHLPAKRTPPREKGRKGCPYWFRLASGDPRLTVFGHSTLYGRHQPVREGERILAEEPNLDVEVLFRHEHAVQRQAHGVQDVQIFDREKVLFSFLDAFMEPLKAMLVTSRPDVDRRIPLAAVSDGSSGRNGNWSRKHYCGTRRHFDGERTVCPSSSAPSNCGARVE
jgi:hypothetical protein